MISYKELPDGLFELLEDYSEDGIKIARGFVWDGASVPWFLRWLLARTDKTKEASMVHDLLYAAGNGVARKEADGIFYEKLLEDNVVPWKAQLMRMGIRLFGWLFFRD